MTIPPNDRPDLMDLLGASWDGRMDEQVRAQIEGLLARDPQAVEHLISFSRFHLDLEWLISAESSQEKALLSVKGSADAAKKQRGQRHLLVGLAGLAASLLVVILGVRNSAPIGHPDLSRAPQPIGRIVRSENAVWADGQGPSQDGAVREHQAIELQRGFAQISLGFGADLSLEGPCRVTLLAEDRVALDRGSLAVRAAKWATGFEVETKNMIAKDLGTWFSVQSDNNGPAEVHVLEGEVLAKSLKASSVPSAPHRLRAHEAINLSQNGTIRSIGFQRKATTERLKQFSPLKPIRIGNTGQGLPVGNKDPNWVVTSGHRDDGPYPQPAVVCVPHGSYGINEPNQSQWISVASGTSKGVPARTPYTFETTFDLTGFDLESVWISGLVLADDGVDEIWLNEKRLDIAAWKNWGYGVRYVDFHPVEIRGGFVPGVNQLAIVVKNETFIYRADHGFDLPDTPNPMALRAEWVAFGRPIAGHRQ